MKFELRLLLLEFLQERMFSCLERGFQLGFEVLSDTDNAVAKQFNLVFSMPEELSALYMKFGIDLEAYNNTKADQLPLAATYVITSDGFISYAFVDVDYTKRAEPIVILEELDKLAK